MALNTLGTNATNTLTGMPWNNTGSQVQDVAAFSKLIKNDDNPAHPSLPQGFTLNGFLFVPNRGILRLQPGDWVGVSSTGFPILISSEAKAADFTSA